jgi:type IV pilus assembly protein PilV
MSVTRFLQARRRAQRGITLVEVLVALVVMAIGLLGISSLYLESLRANRTSLLRAQAIELVNDMADRIRANRRGEAAYVKVVGAATIACAAVTTSYKPEDIAKDDLACWVAAAEARLPRDSTNNPAKTSVRFVPAGAGTLDRYTVRVEWTEPSQADSDALSYQVVFDIQPPI